MCFEHFLTTQEENEIQQYVIKSTNKVFGAHEGCAPQQSQERAITHARASIGALGGRYGWESWYRALDIGIKDHCIHYLIRDQTMMVSCPPKERGGYGSQLLELKCIFKLIWIAKLERNIVERGSSCKVQEAFKESEPCTSCFHFDWQGNN